MVDLRYRTPFFELRGLLRRRYWALRPPQVVAWGGRPSIDYQLGSKLDLGRARLQRIQARRTLAMRRLERAFQQSALSMTMSFRDAMTPAVRDAERSLRKLAESLREAGLTG